MAPDIDVVANALAVDVNAGLVHVVVVILAPTFVVIVVLGEFKQLIRRDRDYNCKIFLVVLIEVNNCSTYEATRSCLIEFIDKNLSKHLRIVGNNGCLISAIIL